MVLAPHCELHLYFIKNIFSQHQPLVFTNISKACVTKLYMKLFTKTVYQIKMGANFIGH